jgi:hypothetical protein
MKRLVFVLLLSSLLCATAWAQMGGGMMQEEAPQSQQWECPQGMMGPGWGMGPGYGMMGQGWGMGPGMMGQGWGMGPGMMGQYGCGMMGHGWGMGRHGYGMMGPGWGMGPGMMGQYGYGRGYGMMGPEHGKKYQKFLDDTRDLRKALHMKRFEYFEAMRDPETTEETMTKLREETRDLMKKIYEKAPWKQ